MLLVLPTQKKWLVNSNNSKQHHPFPKGPGCSFAAFANVPGTFDDALNDPKHNTWEPWLGQKVNRRNGPGDLKSPRVRNGVLVGFLSKWREQKDGGAYNVFLG